MKQHLKYEDQITIADLIMSQNTGNVILGLNLVGSTHPPLTKNRLKVYKSYIGPTGTHHSFEAMIRWASFYFYFHWTHNPKSDLEKEIIKENKDLLIRLLDYGRDI